MKRSDLIIIGSGPAGHTAALMAAKLKFSVTVFEKNLQRLGGTCLNEGCIPLKGYLHCCRHEKNYAALRDTIMGRVAQLRAGLFSRMKQAGITIIEGTARFNSPSEIICNGELYAAEHIIIAAGSQPKRIFSQDIVQSPDILFLRGETPVKSLIIGGGVIGCEYASFLNEMGSSVDIVEALPSILYGTDDEAVRTLVREFKKNKITIYDNARIDNISPRGDVSVFCQDKSIAAHYDLIIEATGRVPDTSALNLSAAEVATDKNGFIEVDTEYRTSAPNVYACGDAIVTPMLAYVASAEAENIITRIAGKNPSSVNYDLMPMLVFSFPQIGSVGIMPPSSKENQPGIEVVTKKYFFKALGKSFIEGNEAGFIKLAIAKESRKIVGASIVGYEAVEILNELSLIIRCGLTEEQVCECAHVHPSYSEIIVEAIKSGV